MDSRRPTAPHLVATVILVLLVATLWLVRFDNAQESASRAIGVSFETAVTGVAIEKVTPGQAAERDGLQAGDLIVGIDGRAITDSADYGLAAAAFAPGQTATFEILREDRQMRLTVLPGRPVDWLPHAIAFFVTLCCLALGILALIQSSHDLRARLIAAFSFLLAVELAMPQTVIGDLRLEFLTVSLFFLVTGAQMAVELHLAALIPERHGWLEKRPWIVPLFYGAGLTFGLLSWASVVSEAVWNTTLPFWSVDLASKALSRLILPLWALGVVGILALAILRHPDARKRHQAGFVLVGVLPWAIYVAATTILGLVDVGTPLWVDDFFSFVVLAFPIGVFISIYRYHLFDIELAVRRGFLYTGLTTSLVLVFYLAVGSLGMLFSKVVDEAQYSLWATAGAMFVVGLLFGNVRRFLQQTIDRLLFPEGQAVRHSLVALASELPAQGNVNAMGRHLVARLGEIFAVRSATLMLADPKSGLFFAVASSQPQEDRFSLSFLLLPQDPALDRLRQEARPLPAAQVTELSPALSQRFMALEAEIVAPLLSHERLVGILMLGPHERGHRFSREEIDLLNLVCRHIAIAFENVRLFESATYEGLTGLLRREAILELLEREIERARRYGRPLVVGMADLDFFKSVNDRYGHLAGDAVLKRVAEELRGGLRSTDAVGRYGGEEFLLVFPETRLEGGATVAEKLRQRIEELSLPIDDGNRIDPRISIGLAELDASPDGRIMKLTDLIEAADKALYRAKEGGRNRVEVSEPPSPLET